jgi:hypothetical protein
MVAIDDGRHRVRINSNDASCGHATGSHGALRRRRFGNTITSDSVLRGGRAMKTLSLKLPPRLSARLERAAKKRGQTKSELVRTALEQFLNGAPPTPPPTPRPMSALELAGDLVGCCEGPGDQPSQHAPVSI